MLIKGLPMLSIQTIRVFGRMGVSQSIQIRSRRQRDIDSRSISDLVEQTISPSVDIRSRQHMISGTKKHHGGIGWQPSPKQKPKAPKPDSGWRWFVRRCCGVGEQVTASNQSVLPTLACAWLNKSRRHMNRRDYGSGLGIGIIADMNGAGSKFHDSKA